MSNVTMSQIAEYVGVSQTTVSFVLNGRERAKGSIGEETRQRVLDAAKELGYKPNHAALSLKTGTTHRIAFWTRFLRDSVHHNRVIPFISEALVGSSYQLEVKGIVPGLGNPAVVPTIAPGSIDGIIAFELDSLAESSLNLLPPVVHMGAQDFISHRGDYVGCNLRQGADDAMQHLLGSGASRLSFMTTVGNNHGNEPRYVAYLEAMAAARLKPEVILLPANQIGESFKALETLAAYLKHNPAPQALFCVNDEVALGAYRALRDHGLRVPEDVLLIGSNGNVESAFVDSPISTIVQPIEEMSRHAWDFLLKRIKTPNLPPQQLVLPAPFVARRSSFYES